MPLFDCHCDTCNLTTEHLLKSNEATPECETCHKPLTKLLSAPAQFTGERIKYVNQRLDKIGASEFKD